VLDRSQQVSAKPIPHPPIAPRTRTSSFGHLRTSASRTYDSFRPDCLIALERRAEISTFNNDGLGFNRAEMHSMRRSRALKRATCSKPGEVEVATEFPVDGGQKVAIEHRCHADRVVVGGNELGQRFFQIGPEQERIARPERQANLAQEVLAGARSKLPIELPRKSTHDILTWPASSHRPAQAVEVTQSRIREC